MKNKKWENKPQQGVDLNTEHEKALCEKYKKPVVVQNWPRDIKSF